MAVSYCLVSKSTGITLVIDIVLTIGVGLVQLDISLHFFVLSLSLLQTLSVESKNYVLQLLSRVVCKGIIICMVTGR